MTIYDWPALPDEKRSAPGRDRLFWETAPSPARSGSRSAGQAADREAREGMTVFERVYEAVRMIPEGSVATYGQVAEAIGNRRLSRVVGYALHVNPQPGVIPCHRVVKRDGELSPAFAFGGINRQAELLRAEGVELKDENHVDMARFRVPFLPMIGG